MEKIKQNIHYCNLIALVCGTICAFLFPNIFSGLSFLGTIYSNMLKIMIIPLLICGISSVISRSSHSHSTIRNTIITFIIMFLLTFLISLMLFTITNNGIGFEFDYVKWNGEIEITTLDEYINQIFPSNLITAMYKNAVLPIIIFSFVLGQTIKKINNGKILQETLGAFTTAFNRMLDMIMTFAPIGIFTLAGNITAYTIQNELFAKYGIFIGTALIAFVVIIIFVMILPVWCICKINPISYLTRVWKVWIIALATQSSIATLPYTLRICNDDFSISRETTDIVVPFGCVIHMCGGAMSFCLLATFIMQMNGIPMNAHLFAMMIIGALAFNMGMPGIGSVWIAIEASYLHMLGLPLDFIGAYSIAFGLLASLYAMLNVSGDVTANLIISEIKNKN